MKIIPNFIFSTFNIKTILILAFVLQTLFFAAAAYMTSGTWLRGDNTFYEFPAWNLANGNGLSFSRQEWEDPYLTELYHNAHPDKAGSEYVPATTLPIGYSIFLAAVYSIFGRSLLAGILANLMLLYISLIAYFFLARRAFGDGLETRIILLLTAIFPLWGFWAAAIMGDVLHITLLSLFALSFFREKSSLGQLILSGVLLGLAAMVRPYAILLPFALAFAGLVFRSRAFNLRNLAIVAVICWALLGGWAARNYYQFGKPMLTSMGLGYGLWVAEHKEVFTDDLVNDKLLEEAAALGLGKPHLARENPKYAEISIERMKQKPFKQVLVTLTSIPRLWISLGGAGFPFAAKALLGVYLTLLLALTIAGIWIARKSANPVVIGSIVIVIYYTLFFAPFGVEGRFVLPARFFSFLLGGLALAYLIRRIPQVEKFAMLQPAAKDA